MLTLMEVNPNVNFNGHKVGSEYFAVGVTVEGAIADGFRYVGGGDVVTPF